MVAGTLELREVFSRVADAAHRVVAFDAMGITRATEAGGIILYAVAGTAGGGTPGRELTFEEISPALRGQGGRVVRIADAPRELDVRHALDREIVGSGALSLLAGPIRRGEAPLGGLWFASKQRDAFSERDEVTLAAIADLLAVALEHERLTDAERLRLRRHRDLEQLVPTLARALDVREVFGQISEIAQKVLPHDRMALGLLEDEGRSVRIYAVSGAPAPDTPESYPILESERDQLDWDFQIVNDIEKEMVPSSTRRAILLKAGMRSSLRVPIYLDGSRAGGLAFHSRQPGRFRTEDVDFAHRVADQVALALSHQRLAEEERRAEEARAAAARLEARVRRLREELESRDGFGRVVGNAKSWRDVLVQASKVAPTDTTVLLTGESGTGKEVIARAIHRASPRADQPFIALNCAALPEQLLESELFGYEKGAFTGAAGAHSGRLEQAAGGTLFLDEVGEMSTLVQAKLLRVLQEREFQRLGGTRVLKADVRVVAATNRDLKGAISRGEFRQDLFYRLSVFEIHLPPLRERREDVLPLTARFLEELGRGMGHPAPGISKEARELLLDYAWPGNVRELRNALERAIILSEGGLIQAEHLPIPVASAGPGPARGAPLASLPPEGIDLDDLERELVGQALERARYNKSRAAKLLGLTRAQLYSRLEKYGIS